jgi:Leucine rich repeat
MSKPRPIHSVHREIRNQPDPAEPSFSYERESFLAATLDREEQVADDFHRKLAGSYRRSDSNSNSNNNSNSNSNSNSIGRNQSNVNSNNNNNNSILGVIGSGPGSIWKGGAGPMNPNQHGSSTNSSSNNGKESPSFTSINLAANVPGSKNSNNSNSNPLRGDGGNVGRISSGVMLSSSGSNKSSQSLLSAAMDDLDLSDYPASGKATASNTRHQQSYNLPIISSPQQNQQQQQQQYGGIGISTKDMNAKKKKDIDKQRSAERRRKIMELDNDQNGHGGSAEISESESLGMSPMGPPTTTISIPTTVSITTTSTTTNTQQPSMPQLPFHPLTSSTTSSSSFSTTAAGRISSSIESQSAFHYAAALSGTSLPIFPGPTGTNLDRSSSDQSTGSVLYNKTPSNTGLFGKSSSLIFPTGVDTNNNSSNNNNSEDDNTEEVAKMKRAKIALTLDQCENNRLPFKKKKLILKNMDLWAADIPLKALCGTSLGNTLYKLDLAGNHHLGSVPPALVQNLPTLRTLDLSQCNLNSLPTQWYLPKLTRLDLSSNKFADFPEEVRIGLCVLV